MSELDNSNGHYDSRIRNIKGFQLRIIETSMDSGSGGREGVSEGLRLTCRLTASTARSNDALASWGVCELRSVSCMRRCIEPVLCRTLKSAKVFRVLQTWSTSAADSIDADDPLGSLDVA